MLPLMSLNGNSINQLEAYAKQKGHADVVVRTITAGIEDSFIRLMNS